MYLWRYCDTSAYSARAVPLSCFPSKAGPVCCCSTTLPHPVVDMNRARRARRRTVGRCTSGGQSSRSGGCPSPAPPRPGTAASSPAWPTGAVSTLVTCQHCCYADTVPAAASAFCSMAMLAAQMAVCSPWQRVMSCRRFKHGGRGWVNPMKAGKAGSKAGGSSAAKQELKSTEQVLQIRNTLLQVECHSSRVMWHCSKCCIHQLLQRLTPSTAGCRWRRNGELQRRKRPGQRASPSIAAAVQVATVAPVLRWDPSMAASASAALAGVACWACALC